MPRQYEHRTIEAAQRALLDMVEDTEAEVGEDYCFSDLVQAVAFDCSPRVKAELYRRELGWVPGEDFLERVN